MAVERVVVPGYIERIDFEGSDLVACKVEKNYNILLGIICGDIFVSKAMALPRNHFSFPKKSSQIIAYFIAVDIVTVT